MHTTVYLFIIQNIHNAYYSIYSIIRNTDHLKCVRQCTYSEYRIYKMPTAVNILETQNIHSYVVQCEAECALVYRVAAPTEILGCQ